MNRYFWRPVIESSAADPLGEIVDYEKKQNLLDQVIIGCESNGAHVGRLGEFKSVADWLAGAADIVEQCKAAGVPVFVKQIPMWRVIKKYSSDKYLERADSELFIGTEQKMVLLKYPRDKDLFPKELRYWEMI